MPPSLSPRPFPAATLRALIDRIIPADEFPGAVSASVETYFRRQFADDCAHEADFLVAGLWLLDAEASGAHGPDTSFTDLDSAKQDALLQELEAGRARMAWPTRIQPATFFARMVELTHEGYYADPSNGGNRDGVSWKMIGYDTRIPPKIP